MKGKYIIKWQHLMIIGIVIMVIVSLLIVLIPYFSVCEDYYTQCLRACEEWAISNGCICDIK